MGFQQAHLHSMARHAIAPGASRDGEGGLGAAEGARLAWWEGGRLICLSSLVFWIAIWRLVSALL